MMKGSVKETNDFVLMILVRYKEERPGNMSVLLAFGPG